MEGETEKVTVKWVWRTFLLLVTICRLQKPCGAGDLFAKLIGNERRTCYYYFFFNRNTILCAILYDGLYIYTAIQL